MANLQVKGIDDALYQELKQLAADENRSVSQQVLFLIRTSLARKRRPQQRDSAVQTLLSLAGSWEDHRTADEIICDIKEKRRSSNKLAEGM